MKYLFVLNDPPYGTERSYNGLRMAREILKDLAATNEVRVFLLGDAASCAHAGQKVPQGFYNVESLLLGVSSRGGQIGVCGTCMDARGLADQDLAKGCARGSMAQAAGWAAWADKVIVF